MKVNVIKIQGPRYQKDDRAEDVIKHSIIRPIEEIRIESTRSDQRRERS